MPNEAMDNPAASCVLNKSLKSWEYISIPGAEIVSNDACKRRKRQRAGKEKGTNESSNESVYFKFMDYVGKKRSKRERQAIRNEMQKEWKSHDHPGVAANI